MAECDQIAEKPHREIGDFKREWHLCLMKGHLSIDCKRRLTCQVCSQKHPNKQQQTNTGCQQKVSSALVSLNHAATSPTGPKTTAFCLFFQFVSSQRKEKKNVETYAFMEPGSSGTFCTDALAKKLNLHCKGIEIVLSTMNATKQVKGCLMKDLDVSGINEGKIVTFPKVFTQRSIPVGRKNIPLQKDIDKWSYLKEVKLSHTDADLGLLNGNDVPKVFEPWRVTHSQNNGPYAVKTILGWTVNGPIRGQEDGEQQNISVNRISVNTIERMLVQQYNKINKIGEEGSKICAL